MSEFSLWTWPGLAWLMAALLVTTFLPSHLQAQTLKKPNILVIWGEDVVRG